MITTGILSLHDPYIDQESPSLSSHIQKFVRNGTETIQTKHFRAIWNRRHSCYLLVRDVHIHFIYLLPRLIYFYLCVYFQYFLQLLVQQDIWNPSHLSLASYYCVAVVTLHRVKMRSIIITFFLASFATTAVYAATSGSINTGFYNKYTVAGGVCFSSSAAVITEVDSYSLGQCCPIISAGKTSYVVFSLRYDYGLLYEDTYSNNVCSGTPRVYSQALDSAKCTWSYTSTLPSDPAITNGNSMWVTNNYYTNPTFCTAHGMPLYALKTQVAAIGSTLHPTCVPDGTGKGFQMYYQT